MQKETNELKISIALLTFIDPRGEFYENFKEVKGMDLKEESLKTHEAAKNILQPDRIVDLGVIDSEAKVYNAIDKMRDVDGIFLNVPGWTPPGWGGILSSHVALPILLYAPFALSGPLAMKGELTALGADFDVSFGQEKKIKEFKNQVKARKLFNLLKGKKFGQLGGISMGMHYTEALAIEALKNWGIEIVYIDGTRILSKASRLKEQRVNRFIEKLKSSVKSLVFDDREVLKRQISYYLAIKEITEEDEIDFLALKCQPEFSDFYGTLCFAPSFLPLPSDFEGEKRIIPVSCEGDFFASFSGYVLSLLSGKPPLFADFIMPLYEENLLALQNCGGASIWYSELNNDVEHNLAKVSIVRNIQGQCNSCCIDFSGKEIEEVTVLGMGRKGYTFWVEAEKGKVLEREDLKPLLMDWPTVFLKVNDVRECLEKFHTQHIMLVPGDYNEILNNFKKIFERETKLPGLR